MDAGVVLQDVPCHVLNPFPWLLRIETPEEQICHNVCFYKNRAQDLRESLSEARSLPIQKPFTARKTTNKGAVAIKTVTDSRLTV